MQLLVTVNKEGDKYRVGADCPTTLTPAQALVVAKFFAALSDELRCKGIKNDSEPD